MIQLKPSEIKFTFIRAPGPGGQNVNKVSTGVLLRFDVTHSSLPDDVKTRLKTTTHGEILIKATRFRTQEKNKQDALHRLEEIINRANYIPKKRKKTKPTLGSKQRRLTEKKLHGKNKSLRRHKPINED